MFSLLLLAEWIDWTHISLADMSVNLRLGYTHSLYSPRKQHARWTGRKSTLKRNGRKIRLQKFLAAIDQKGIISRGRKTLAPSCNAIPSSLLEHIHTDRIHGRSWDLCIGNVLTLQRRAKTTYLSIAHLIIGRQQR